MQESDELKKKLGELLEFQRLAVLSTHCQGQPYASLVAFAASLDLKEFYFATPKTTRKYANLKADSRVALLIDSRTNQAADIHRAMAATAVGKAWEVAGEERKKVLDYYLSRHPHLEEFSKSPSCAVIRITVETFYVVERFQKVMELHIKS